MYKELKLKMYKLVITLAILAITIPACNQPTEVRSPPGYNLNEPERFAMPESLLEISGIAFKPGHNDTIYAIQDEEGKVFRLPWGIKTKYHSKFAKSGDYEDISFLNGKVYVLKSNGQLYSFSENDLIYEEVDSVQIWEDLLPKGEYESLYGDEATGNLYVLCKNCKQDKNDEEISGFILKYGDTITRVGNFRIDVGSVKAFAGSVKRGFRPSALAKNQVDGNWYILSAVNKLLVVADNNWSIKAAYKLDGNRFHQPEGIAFDSDGNLYISNEGDDISDGNILRFVRK